MMLDQTSHPPIIFFSDSHFGAHGEDQEKRKAEAFVNLMAAARTQGAEVFYLGDLFDFWFEYKYWIPKTDLSVLWAIREFTQSGGTFHLLVGNHDYWMEDYFERTLGVTVYHDDTTVIRHGLRLYLSHGDGKSPREGGYRRLRSVLRFRPNILLYRLLPADWAYILATYSSRQSRGRHLQHRSLDTRPYRDVASSLLASGFDAVIMGHLHDAWVEPLKNGWWINCGEFYEQFHYVVLEVGQFRLERWTQKSHPNNRSNEL